MLATHSLYPIIQRFAAAAGVDVEQVDISLAGRILAAFPERLPEGRSFPDNLARLDELTQFAETNIIKLANISASVRQLTAAIAEHRDNDFDLPDYPEDPQTDEEREIAIANTGDPRKKI